MHSGFVQLCFIINIIKKEVGSLRRKHSKRLRCSSDHRYAPLA